MNTSQPLLKRLASISVIAVGVLFIMGMVFYRERVYFADASFILFSITNLHEMAIQWGRYGSFIVQLFPYLGQKMHLPVDTLAFLYGMSFNFFYLISISLLVYWHKQYRLAILLALFYFLLVSESFIWISEIPQGITWLFLCYGLTLYLGRKNVNIFLILLPFIPLAYLAIATHFVILIPAVFLWGYFIMEKDFLPFSRNKIILLSSVLAAIIITKFAIAMGGPSDTGEGPLLQGVLHPTLKGLFYSLKTPVIKMFVYRCIINYWAAIILFIVGFVSLVKQKRYLPALWTTATCAGYILIMGLTYGKYDRNIPLLHIESEWICFAIVAATPFVFSFLPGNEKKYIPWLFTTVLVVRLLYILVYIPAFTARNEKRQEILGQMRKKGINKLAIYTDGSAEKTFMLTWALSFESIMNSQSAGDKPQRVFMFVNKTDTSRLRILSDTKGMSIDWDQMQGSRFSPDYFTIDTTPGYKIMTYEDLMK